MPINHLEQLIAEWLEYQGYFVRRNAKVGKRKRGGYECELDIVAFHPGKKRLVHYEPSTDTHSWAQRESRYRKKFDAGKKYIPMLFDGTAIPGEIEQFAVFLYGSNSVHKRVGGGEVLTMDVLMREITRDLRTKPIAKAIVPEQFALLRVLHLACEFRSSLFPPNAEQQDNLLIRATDVSVCSNRLIPSVLKEWREPRHDVFLARNVWSLFNAFTESLKEGSLSELPKRTQALHALLDVHCGLNQKREAVPSIGVAFLQLAEELEAKLESSLSRTMPLGSRAPPALSTIEFGAAFSLNRSSCSGLNVVSEGPVLQLHTSILHLTVWQQPNE